MNLKIRYKLHNKRGLYSKMYEPLLCYELNHHLLAKHLKMLTNVFRGYSKNIKILDKCLKMFNSHKFHMYIECK
ncbi:hypothetical protein UFO1_0807 [Pelosinus sp. UFO1]|nr:hypothetical protein UFO1_0807 [Pelosinus sp. UFO1]